MELILISSSKLKIMLSGEDMEKYNLDAEKADYDNTATRRAFWSILDDAKNKTGFNAAGDRVFIQLYPSKEGGCEMFVTKMGLLCSAIGEDGKTMALFPGSKTIKSLIEKCEDNSRERIGVYGFDDLSSLLSVCRQLLSRKWRGKSEAFRGENGKCYLILREKTPDTGAVLDRLSFISEYGKTEKTDTVRLYIREHATCICRERAVQTLGVL